MAGKDEKKQKVLKSVTDNALDSSKIKSNYNLAEKQEPNIWEKKERYDKYKTRQDAFKGENAKTHEDSVHVNHSFNQFKDNESDFAKSTREGKTYPTKEKSKDGEPLYLQDGNYYSVKTMAAKDSFGVNEDRFYEDIGEPEKTSYNKAIQKENDSNQKSRSEEPYYQTQPAAPRPQQSTPQREQRQPGGVRLTPEQRKAMELRKAMQQRQGKK